MSWIAAIKKYAADTGTSFTIPKRDTPEYDAIKKIQMGGAEMKAPAPAKEMGAERGVVVAGPGPGIVADPGKRRRKRKIGARVPAAADAAAIKKRRGGRGRFSKKK